MLAWVVLIQSVLGVECSMHGDECERERMASLRDDGTNARYQSLRCNTKYPDDRYTEGLTHRSYDRARRYKSFGRIGQSVSFGFRKVVKGMQTTARAKNAAKSVCDCWEVRLADVSGPGLS